MSITDPTLTLTCQQCGNSFDKKASWLKSNPKFPCPNCGKPVVVDEVHLENALKAIKPLADKIDKLPPWMRRGG